MEKHHKKVVIKGRVGEEEEKERRKKGRKEGRKERKNGICRGQQ